MADEHTVDSDIQDSVWPMRNKDELELGGVVMRDDPSFEPEVLPRKSIDRSFKCGDKAQKVYSLFTLGAVTADKFDLTQADILFAVYDKTQGFITPFHTELWSESWRGPGKEGFHVPWDISTEGGQTKNLQLAVLVVNGPECFRNRRCRGVGVLSLDDIKSSVKEAGADDEGRLITLPPLSIEVTSSGKEPVGTALEQLQKVLEKTQKRTQSAPVKTSKIFSVTIFVRKVRSSNLEEDCPLLDRIQIPTLLSPKENKIGITLDKGRIAMHDLFGNVFGVSLEVSLLSSDGTEATSVRTNAGKTTNGYLSLVSPKHDSCEWKESLCIDLGTERMVEEWKNYHIRIAIYTHRPASESKLFGFAFLPLFDSRGILRDISHKLFIFKTSHLPNPEQYLNKEWLFDGNMPHKVLELQNGPKFKVSKDSFLQLRTTLSSTEVTEDIDIQALKCIDPMLSDDQVNDIFASFISNSKKANNQAKRILFFRDLLDSLWSVLERAPNQEDNVFNSFIETIKPIVTRPNDFGYAEAFLDDYIRTQFKSPLLFQAFLKSFSANLTEEPSLNSMYTLMSMKHIFKIIVQSLKFTNDKKNTKPLETFLSSLQEFILKKNQSKEVQNRQNQALKSLFEDETISILREVFPSVKLIDILDSLLSEKDTREHMSCITIAVMINVLRSNLFSDLKSQRRICEIALKMIQSQFRKSNNRESFRGEFCDAENQFKKRTMELIQELHSACQTDGPGAEDRKSFIKVMTECVIVELANLIVGEKKLTNGQTLEEKIFFTLINQFDDDLLSRLVKDRNISFFDDVFLICQRVDEPQDADSTKSLANILSLVGQKGILEVTGSNLGAVENYLKAISSLAQTSNSVDVVRQHANTMRQTIRGLPRENIHALLSRESKTKGTKGPVVLNSVCSVVRQMADPAFENQETTGPELVFEIFLAEFFAKVNNRFNNSFPMSHTWFIEQVDGGEAKNMNTLCRDRLLPRILKNFEDFSNSWRKRPDFSGNVFICEDRVQLFIEKFKIWMKHVERLLSVSEEVERVEAERDSQNKQVLYFGELTALHNKYKALMQLKKEAVEEKLLSDKDEDGVDTYRDQCILVLTKIHKILVKSDQRDFMGTEQRDKNSISSGYTLYELSKIIPWSEKTAPGKIQIWINEIISNENPSQNPSQKWGEMKEALCSIAIKTFQDATGFECSIRMIKESIKRCEFELFNFEELANLHKNLAEIYEYRHDFQKKLEQESQEDYKMGQRRARRGKERTKEDKAQEEMRRKYLLRQHVINPEYYKITFRNPPKWLKFLENKSYIYRGDAMLQMSQMWGKLETWFPGAVIKNLQEDLNNTEGEGSEMTIFCGKVCNMDSWKAFCLFSSFSFSLCSLMNQFLIFSGGGNDD